MSLSHQWIEKVWYEGAWSGLILLPLSWIYRLILAIRSALYQSGAFRTYKAPAPVIIVGNITAGGTGKTPTVLWLVQQLAARGYNPGIVSRGYGGSKSGTSMRVDADSDPAVVGDEPVLLARRAQVPLAVDADRVRAATMLVDDGVDVIVADDGLQHRRLERDYEICVVDGTRGLGNRRLLPAGPLRESPRRLDQVDRVLVNGGVGDTAAYRFDLVASEACRLDGSLARPLDGFRNKTVHAVAAIGNPQRFFDTLREHGIQVIEHAFPDHQPIARSALKFGDGFDVFMTEKDAVKLGRSPGENYWYVPVNFEMEPVRAAAVLDHIVVRLQQARESHG